MQHPTNGMDIWSQFLLIFTDTWAKFLSILNNTGRDSIIEGIMRKVWKYEMKKDDNCYASTNPDSYPSINRRSNYDELNILCNESSTHNELQHKYTGFTISKII